MNCDFAALSEALQSGDPEQAQQTLDVCTAMLTDPSLWYWAVGFTIACALGGALIGRYKNAVVRDTLLGLALGPIGWAISLLLPKVKAKPLCQNCKQVVDGGDKHCRHCGAALR